MTNPIEIVASARKRIGRLAAIRILLAAALPFGVTLAIAIALNRLNALAFDNFGYLIDPVPARVFQFSLLLLVLVEMIVVSALGWRAWSYHSDFLRAAEQIDRCTGGQQEIITLASLSNPVRPELANMRSPLFPLLWTRVAASLETFNPRSVFALEFRQPLVRSVMLAAVAVILLATAAFALMTRPNPAELVTRRLEILANTMSASPSGSPEQQLASAARDVAKDLVNPKLPPQEKIAELRALEQELQKFQPPHRGTHQSRGSSSGSSANGSGGGEGEGTGSASGRSSGSSAAASGAGKGGRPDQEMVELHNNIAKAQTKLEEEAASGPRNSGAEKNSSTRTGRTPKPGSNPRLPGQDSSTGSGQVSEPQTLARANSSSGQSLGSHRNDTGSMGDTHLGEFPKQSNYQRFYKLGENGPPINIRDARYVTFRLPTEIESPGEGAIVPDNSRLQATTPDTNAPLKQRRLAASPDEQQLVPPRYRELIH